MDSFVFISFISCIVFILNVCFYKKVVHKEGKSEGDIKCDECSFIVYGLVQIMLIFIIYSLFIVKTPLNSSQTVMLDYLSQSYNSNITENSVESVFRANNDEIEVLSLDIVEIPETNSKRLNLEVRKGELIYSDYEYSFYLKPGYSELLHMISK